MQNEETKKELGQELKTLREKAFPNDSLRRVAGEVGIEYTHLFRIEAGQYTPSDDNLTKILDTYNATPNEKLSIFSLARVTPAHKEAYLEAAKNLNAQDVVALMFRKEKK